jgi:hypothetical protein
MTAHILLLLIIVGVNGSEQAFTDTMYPYEVNSTLNDASGAWLKKHSMNRYRDWDELRFSIRTVEKYAHNVINKIQVLVNSVGTEGIAAKATGDKPAVITGKQVPQWLNTDEETKKIVEVVAHEDFFDKSEKGCLPTFNSMTIENQIYNTKSTVDRVRIHSSKLECANMSSLSTSRFQMTCHLARSMPPQTSTPHFSDQRWDSSPKPTTR